MSTEPNTPGMQSDWPEYSSKFRDWPQKAALGKENRDYESPFVDGMHFYSPDLCPLLGHPEVAAAGDDAVRDLLVRQLYMYLDFTVRLETGPVNKVALWLADPHFLIWLPRQMKDDALRIYTDEAGHAEMSNSLTSRVALWTGVTPDPTQPQFLEDLERLSRDGSRLYRPLIMLFFVIVSETLITGSLTHLPKDPSVQEAVRNVASDHALDEGKHHRYFSDLLGHIWPRLPVPLQDYIGPLIPRLIRAFLEPDVHAMNRIVRHVPGLEEHALRIAQEVAVSPQTRDRIRASAQPSLKTLEKAGVLRQPHIRDAFESHGLVMEDR